MSEFVPLKDQIRVLAEQDFVSHGERSNIPVAFEPEEVSWKPTIHEEPAVGEEPILFFLSRTGSLVGEVKKKLENEDDLAWIHTAPIVEHFFANKFDGKVSHHGETILPMLNYGPELSINEVKVSSAGQGELRRAATCFLQTLDPRWMSTSEVFRRYDPFTSDPGWITWDTAQEGRCNCNLVCLLFRTKQELGLDLRVGNAMVSIASKEEVVRFPDRGQPNELPEFVPELKEGDLYQTAVNDCSFVVENSDAAMIHLSTASLQGILEVMFMTVCFCPMEGIGLPLNRQFFPDINYLRHRGDICRLDTTAISEIPEEFKQLIHVDPDDETENPVPPAFIHFKETETPTARGLKRRTTFEVGSYVEMRLMKNDESSVPVALGIIAHLPEINPIKKVKLRGKEYKNERLVGACFTRLLDAKHSEMKYEMGLRDRSGYEIQTIGEFVVGEEYLWDLCHLSPLHHLPEVADDVKVIMERAKSQFLERWNAKHKETYTADYESPPNWRKWDMEDRSIVPIEL